MINISRRLFTALFALLGYFNAARFTLGSPCRKVTVTGESQGTSTPSDSSQQAGVQSTGKKHGKKCTLTPTSYSLRCYKLLKLEGALETKRTVAGFLKAPTPTLPKAETGAINESHYHHQRKFLLHQSSPLPVTFCPSRNTNMLQKSI